MFSIKRKIDKNFSTIIKSSIREIMVEKNEKIHFSGDLLVNSVIDRNNSELFLVFVKDRKKFLYKIESYELIDKNNLKYTFNGEIPIQWIRKSLNYGLFDCWLQIKKEGKLVDTQKLTNEIDQHKHNLYLSQNVLWKLSSMEDSQLRVTSINAKKESRKYQIENELLHFEVINSTTALFTIFALFNEEINDKKFLRIASRKTGHFFDFPFDVNENKEGTVEIDFQKLPSNEFLYGIWDFYLVEHYSGLEVVSRLTFTNENWQGEHSTLLVQNNNRYSDIKFYQTIKGNFSIILDNVSVQGTMSNFKMDGWKLHLSAQLQNRFLSKMDIHLFPVCRLIKRNTNEQIDFHAEMVIDEESDIIHLETIIDFEKIIQENSSEIKGRWDFQLVSTINDKEETILLSFPEEQINRYQYMWDFIQNDEKLQCYLYSSRTQGLCFTINSLRIIRDVEVFKTNNKTLKIKGWAFVDGKNSTQEMKRNIILHKRFTEEKIVIPLNSSKRPDITERFGKEIMDYQWSGFETKINLQKINNGSILSNGIWDFYIVIEFEGEIITKKLGFRKFVYRKDRSIRKASLFDKQIKKIKDHYFSLTPRGNIKIEVLSFDFYSKLLMLIHPLLYIFLYKKKDIWIIGERPDTAQDTGYHFFKYCREKFPNKEIYYAIDPESNDIENIRNLGNVLYFGTRKHFLYTLLASTYISSHDNEYFLPFKGYSLFNYRKARKIFIQHGVLGRKNVEYHRKYYDYPFDMFCVSSEGEQELVVNSMQYPKKNVKITGLSRFDALPLQQDLSGNRKILCIPTWREWLNTEEAFLESVYFKRYSELLQSEELQKILETYNLEFIFYPHYRMQPYIEHFNIPDNPRMKIIKLGEKNVQDLLIESSIMITDFSSVSFDFSYMSKPVIFYHFDFDDFFKRGILRAPEETFLGSIVNNVETMNNELKEYIKNDFKEKEQVSQGKDLIFTYIDHKNCERMYHEITQIKKRGYYPEKVKLLYRKTIGRLT
ncbi:CDP-glycerol glycerophosphotransferase family protein [Margalitia sp. FSL K6-0131]|uniref:CDP-glycerol glycerophosphotransferase family protein n=1 Tax=Margalitia sp. FSL K6-0131 TaxID=2954604 RepID=UPI0030F6E5B5